MVFGQYSSLFSLVFFLLSIFPAIWLGLNGKNLRKYGMIASLPVLCLLMGFCSSQFWQFGFCILLDVVLIKLYNKYKRFYVLVFVLTAFPLFLAKISERISGIIGGYNIVGFIGISYISFRVWQLLFEAHDGNLGKTSFVELLYFITFFPTITSGPIDRYKRFKLELNLQIPKDEYMKDYLIPGIKKVLRGIVYKFAIAAFIKIYIIDKIPEDINYINTLIYMYAYTLFLFFDFAGYSNFAIGTSYFLGIKTSENFNQPFLAHNMKEFWERWHISLSKWLNDYVFSRFVLSVLRSKKIKSKKIAVRIGYMLTMALMGLWHGFYLFYVLYGVYQGLMLVLTDVYLKSKIFRNFKKHKYYSIISRVVCFHVIAIGMLIFSGYLFKF